MKARIVRVGNSRGIRLPKLLLEQSGLEENVELHAEPGRIVIETAFKPRAGWAEAAARMSESGDDVLILPSTSSRFDDEDWTWR